MGSLEISLYAADPTQVGREDFPVQVNDYGDVGILLDVAKLRDNGCLVRVVGQVGTFERFVTTGGRRIEGKMLACFIAGIFDTAGTCWVMDCTLDRWQEHVRKHFPPRCTG